MVVLHAPTHRQTNRNGRKDPVNRAFFGLGLFLALLGMGIDCGFSGEAAEEGEAARGDVEARGRTQILSYFLGNPKDASGLKTPISIDRYNQGVEFYQKKEYELARQALEEAISHDSRNHLALELLGDIDYYEQKLGEAKSHYEAAFRLKPRRDLKKKIEKVEKEKSVEAGLATYREEHFLIKYAGEDRGLEGFELRELLRTTYREVGQDLGYFFKHKVVVLLYDEEEFRELSGAPHWSSGVYDGKIRLPAYRKGLTLTEIQKVMRHELTHAFVVEMSRGLCPAWLNEGLAEYEEAKVEAPDLRIMRAAIKTNTLYPLSTLFAKTGLVEVMDPLEVQLFYVEAYAVVKYIAERYSMFHVKKMLELFRQGKDSFEVVQEVLKISPLELENRWKESLTQS